MWWPKTAMVWLVLNVLLPAHAAWGANSGAYSADVKLRIGRAAKTGYFNLPVKPSAELKNNLRFTASATGRIYRSGNQACLELDRDAAGDSVQIILIDTDARASRVLNSNATYAFKSVMGWPRDAPAILRLGLDQPLTLAYNPATLLKALKQLPGLKLKQSGSATVSGETCKIYEFTARIPAGKRQMSEEDAADSDLIDFSAIAERTGTIIGKLYISEARSLVVKYEFNSAMLRLECTLSNIKPWKKDQSVLAIPPGCAEISGEYLSAYSEDYCIPGLIQIAAEKY